MQKKTTKKTKGLTVTFHVIFSWSSENGCTFQCKINGMIQNSALCHGTFFGGTLFIKITFFILLILQKSGESFGYLTQLSQKM